MRDRDIFNYNYNKSVSEPISFIENIFTDKLNNLTLLPIMNRVLRIPPTNYLFYSTGLIFFKYKH